MSVASRYSVSAFSFFRLSIVMLETKVATTIKPKKAKMVLDSSSPMDVETEVVIENFDPTITEGSYYIIGDLEGKNDVGKDKFQV